MASVRALAARVARLEQASVATSPIAAAFGSFAAFEAFCEAGIADGVFDPRDVPFIVGCWKRWESDGTWASWTLDRVWERGR